MFDISCGCSTRDQGDIKISVIPEAITSKIKIKCKTPTWTFILLVAGRQ